MVNEKETCEPQHPQTSRIWSKPFEDGSDQILEYPVDIPIITSGYSSLRPCSAALRLYLARNLWKEFNIDTSTLRFNWKLHQGLICPMKETSPKKHIIFCIPFFQVTFLRMVTDRRSSAADSAPEIKFKMFGSSGLPVFRKNDET